MTTRCPAERLRVALADIAVAADDGDLARDHHVGRAAHAVDQRVPAAVEVVELRLRDRVVDVDRREQQRAGFGHLVKAVHTGGGLLGDALGSGPLPCGARGMRSSSGVDACQELEDDLELLGVRGRRVRNLTRLLETGCRGARRGSRRRRRPGSCSGRRSSGQRNAFSVQSQYSLSVSPFHAVNPDAGRGDRGGGVVLGREDVAGRPNEPRRRAWSASRSALRSGWSCAASR